jgi:hypothetical protein
VVAEMKDEFARRTAKIKWKSMLPDDYQLPLYEPPKWFLQRTGQAWPPPGVTLAAQADRLDRDRPRPRTRAATGEPAAARVGRTRTRDGGR